MERFSAAPSQPVHTHGRRCRSGKVPSWAAQSLTLSRTTVSSILHRASRTMRRVCPCGGPPTWGTKSPSEIATAAISSSLSASANSETREGQHPLRADAALPTSQERQQFIAGSLGSKAESCGNPQSEKRRLGGGRHEPTADAGLPSRNSPTRLRRLTACMAISTSSSLISDWNSSSGSKSSGAATCARQPWRCAGPRMGEPTQSRLVVHACSMQTASRCSNRQTINKTTRAAASRGSTAVLFRPAIAERVSCVDALGLRSHKLRCVSRRYGQC